MGKDLESSQILNSQSPIKTSKKKRKRDKERVVVDGAAAVEPQQPPVTEKLRVDVKLEVVNDQGDKTPPIVGYFPSGYNPNRSIEVDSNSQEPNLSPAVAAPTVRFYRNAQRAKVEKSEKHEKGRGSERLELVVSPNGMNVEFVGKSYKGEAMAAQLCTYALGVLDKETQTLKIMPIAGNKILRLEPKVQGLHAPNEEPSIVENEKLTGEEKAAQTRKLNRIFGAKRSYNQDEKVLAVKKGEDPLSQEDLGRKLENVPVNKEALESTSGHAARNIPPYNSSADTPQEAYPLDKIILNGEWDFLKDIYHILQVGGEVASDAYPAFVRNRIHKLQECQDEVEKKRLSCIFSYITHLIKFKDLHALDYKSYAKNHRFPSIIQQKFLEMFSPERRRLSKEKIDLLVSYVLVLTLYADDFRTLPADIATDLRMGPDEVRDYFKNLGCKFAREKNKGYLATLPLPLEFPQPKKKSRRR